MVDLDMTPYAVFVWSSWAISAVVLAAVAARALIAARRWKRALAELEAEPSPSRPQVGRRPVGQD